jgi:glycosyltransferase involved in cell wall biosynthesis
MKLSVVIPVRNEAANIGPTLDAIRGHLVGEDINYESLVVNDGSPGSTAEEVSE